jgi:hypothetical protein
MRFIGGVIEKLQRHPKRIVFPEGTEPRVLQAARQFHSLRLGVPILLGERSAVKEAASALNVSLEGIRIIHPAESPDLDSFVKRFEMIRRSKGIKEQEAREAMIKPNYFGAMMVGMRQADGLVSGTNEISGSVLRPLFQIIKVAPRTTTASSCMVMEVEDSRFGDRDSELFGGHRGDRRTRDKLAVFRNSDERPPSQVLDVFGPDDILEIAWLRDPVMDEPDSRHERVGVTLHEPLELLFLVHLSGDVRQNCELLTTPDDQRAAVDFVPTL